MKLVTFTIDSPQQRSERLGAFLGQDEIVDLNVAHAWLSLARNKPSPVEIAGTLVPPDMNAFLAGGESGIAAAQEALTALAGQSAESRRNLRMKTGKLIYTSQEVRLLPPVPRPPALRDFMSFEEHAKRNFEHLGEPLPKGWYDAPVFYKGNHREIYGPDDVIPWPSYTRRLDYEVEIACVIGSKGRNLAPEQAQRHIAGYTILNDFSARDIQKREMSTRMGPAKGKDFATALGPYLITPDEMPDLDSLVLTATINGEKWSEGYFKERCWDFATMIAYASQEETVYPGDVLGSGTFYKGCGLDLGLWLKPGDVIDLEVTGMRVLRNIIGQPPQDRPSRPLTYPRRTPQH